MSRPPILLLFNPAAGGKPGASRGDKTDGPQLRAALEERGLDVRLHELAADDNLTSVARSAVADGYDVVAAGGDGTVRGVATGMLGSDARLGIVPLGSFNNVAHSARLPMDGIAAIDTIARGDLAHIDVAVVWTLDSGSPTPAQVDAADAPADATWFLEAAGIGVDAAGFDVAAIPKRGVAPATRAVWSVLRRRRSVIPLHLDGYPAGARSPAITVCNGPFHGFGFALAPEADLQDGLLDVVVFRHMGRLEVLAHFMAVARGRPRREPRVQATRARSIVVGDHSEPLPVHADGVPIGSTPVAIAVKPAALKLFR